MSPSKFWDSLGPAGLELASVRGSMGVCVSVGFVSVQATSLLGLEGLSTRSRGEFHCFPVGRPMLSVPPHPAPDRSGFEIPHSHAPSPAPSLWLSPVAPGQVGRRPGDPKCGGARTPSAVCILRPLSCPQASWEGGQSCMALYDHPCSTWHRCHRVGG